MLYAGARGETEAQMAQHNDAGLRIVGFGCDPEIARQMINRWVADETQDRIDNIRHAFFVVLE